MAERKAPDVSIDEALELFLAISYPGGIPEGVDRAELFAALRKKIAADRPAWAAASTAPDAAPAQKTNPGTNPAASAEDPVRRSWSAIKAEIARQSNRPEVPEDPEERFFYERNKEAAENIEERRAEEREDQIRADLRSRLIDSKKARNKAAQKAEGKAEQKRKTHPSARADETLLERTLQIRQELEKRLLSGGIAFSDREKTDIQESDHSHEESEIVHDEIAYEKSGKANPSRQVDEAMALEGPTKPGAAPPDPNRRPADEFDLSRIRDIEKLNLEKRIEAMREYNRARRAEMKSKREVLTPRIENRKAPARSGLRNELQNDDKSKRSDAFGMNLSQSVRSERKIREKPLARETRDAMDPGRERDRNRDRDRDRDQDRDRDKDLDMSMSMGMELEPPGAGTDSKPAMEFNAGLSQKTKHREFSMRIQTEGAS